MRGPGSGPWCPWCLGLPSCPWTPRHDPRWSWRSWLQGRDAGGAASSSFGVNLSVNFRDRHEVTHGVDHAPDLGAVLLDDHVTDPLEAERAQGVALVRLAADGGLRLLDLQARHHCAPAACAFAASMPSALALSNARGAMSSTAMPRRAATASGSSRERRAAIVACTMLIWFEEPSDLLSTSWMPAHSSTARTGPPAITPVPGAAGRRSTTPAAFSPWTGCGIVPWMRGTRKKFFFASSTPLAIAAGTSLALP